MSKIRLTGSNSGYVEIAAAADAGNLTFTLPTTGTDLFGNGNNVISGITTFSAALDINSNIDVSGTSVFNNDVTFDGATAGYDVVWDRSDNQLEFADNAKISFGGSLQIYRDGTNTRIQNSTNTLRIAGDSIKLNNGAISKNFLVAENDAVQLMYNNNTKFVTTNTGAVVTGICTATSFSGSGENLTRTTQLSHRNLIINGAMMVAQRGTSSTTSGYGSVDRFTVNNTGTDESPTQSQVDVASGTSPYVRGFRKALRVTNGNQTGGAGTLDFITIRYKLEAQDIANCGWRYMYNTSGDDFITLSFWVKSSVAQNFYGYLYSHDGSAQSYAFETGSLTANQWTKVTKTIPGNSNLTFDNNNDSGLDIYISQFWGTDRTDGGKSLNTWASYNGAARTRDFDQSWYTTDNATFELTGVQLEVGEQATPFEHRSFTEELTRCYRYYRRFGANGALPTPAVYNRLSIGYAPSSSVVRYPFQLDPPMRINPVNSNFSNSGNFNIQPGSLGSGSFSCDDLASSANMMIVKLDNTSVTAGTGAAVSLHHNNDATAYMDISAEI